MSQPGAAVIPVENASWIVGSYPDCDIIIQSPSVSSHHCRLLRQASQYLLEDLGSTNGTFVNGYQLQPQSPVPVSRNDQINLGRNVAFQWPLETFTSVGPRSDTRPQNITIGRAPENAIQLDYPMISWNHARIITENGGWIIEDLGSANGTAINRIDNKILRSTLQPADEIFFGSFKIVASHLLTKKHLAQGEGAFELVPVPAKSMVLGRDPTCDYPLNYPMISWRHARLDRSQQKVFVEDLDSRNGTYVNGVRITNKTEVLPGQEIGLGTFRFQLREDGALVKREYSGNVTIEVSSVVVNAPNGTRLLDPVSLTIFPSELIALMGPAGAGKTTFLKALNGYTAPSEGLVLFNGADLYRFYDRFRQQMSYVPQDDIVHAQLTVREALYFSAKLRTDLTDVEIDRRIDDILKSLGLEDKKNAIIGSPERKVLSGGQRKRVNIAMELIADTPVIFLDEPTSGLSSYDAEGVVKLLKKLAESGKTIITTIHQPSLDVYREFDSLIMISRDRGGCGAMAYFGPAYPDSIEFFNPELAPAEVGAGPEMLLSGLAKKPTGEWVQTYGKSRYKDLFVTGRSGKIPSINTQGQESARRGFGFGQWATLVRRNFLLKLRDRAQLMILLIQAPLFALLVGLVFGKLKTNELFQSQVAGIEFLMVVAAVWFGCNNVARDIVGEWSVYQRERMVSLKLPSYIFSKLFVAGILSLLQCLVLLGLINVMCGLHGNFIESLGILYVSSLVGSSMGLCVSARSVTTEAAIAMLPLILLPVIALGGGIWTVNSMSEPLRQVAKMVPSRWAFEGMILTEARGGPKTVGRSCPQSPCEDAAAMSFPLPSAVSTPGAPPTLSSKRTSVQTCVLILAGMLLFWLSLALGFLRMRDVH